MNLVAAFWALCNLIIWVVLAKGSGTAGYNSFDLTRAKYNFLLLVLLKKLNLMNFVSCAFAMFILFEICCLHQMHWYIVLVLSLYLYFVLFYCLVQVHDFCSSYAKYFKLVPIYPNLPFVFIVVDCLYCSSCLQWSGCWFWSVRNNLDDIISKCNETCVFIR